MISLPDFIPAATVADHVAIDFTRMTPDLWRRALEWALSETTSRTDQAEAMNPALLSTDDRLRVWSEMSAALDAVHPWFYHQHSIAATPELDAVNEWLAPEMSRLSSRIMQSDKLAAWWAISPERAAVDERRFQESLARNFKAAGAGLPDNVKKDLAEVLAQIAAAEVEFVRLNLANNDNVIPVRRLELKGVSKDLVGALAVRQQHATDESLDVLDLPVGSAFADPVLEQAGDRALRERVWAAWTGRGRGISENDQITAPVLSKILALRHRQAGLLGHGSFAEMKLVGTMAGTVDQVRSLVRPAVAMAVQSSSQDLASLHATAIKSGFKGPLQPWDVAYYRRRHMNVAFDIPMDQVKDFFPLDGVRAAAFRTAERLFGLTFAEVDSPKGLPKGSRLFRVFDDGQPLGAMITDDFARPGKQAGAWMMSLRTAQSPTDERGLVINCLNLPNPPDGSPALLSFDDAVTLFHEFGHALHGLLGRTRIPGQAGTEVVRDFVEFPSQIMENWIKSPQGLSLAARHWKTGEPMPPDLIDRLAAANAFGKCLDTVAAQQSAWVDLEIHAAAPPPDAAAFERAQLKEIQASPLLPPRHALSHFAHIFGWDYSAGYYSYVWAEALEADAFDRFSDDLFDPAAAADLKKVFSAGGSQDPAILFEEFRGRPVDPEALGRRWRGSGSVSARQKTP